MTDVQDWYQTIPQFTKYWFTGTVGLSLAERFGLLRPEWLVLVPRFVFHNFHIWRPITSLFFYPLTPQTGFHFMFNCYFLYNYSKRLEQDHFKNTPSDYLFLLIFNWFSCVVLGLAMGFYYLMDPMVLSVLYVWCYLNKDVIVNFWFGTRFKARYLPWVLLAFNFILSSGSAFSVAGILVGHLYCFLKFQYPQELGGPSLLQTPSILKRYFPDVTGGISFGFGVPPVNRQPAPGQAGQGGAAGGAGAGNRMFGGHSWGRGQVLGRN